jgi:DNA-binding YbaB/EbfC family protein
VLKGSLTDLMKQAQAMQGEVAKMQEEISAVEVVGEAGGGMVKVRMNGRKDVLSVKIESQSIIEDLEMVQDLLAIAFNDASKRADKVTREKMSKATSGLDFLNGLN